MKYRLLLAFVMLLCITAAWGWRSIIIDARDGSRHTVNLSDSLSMSFTPDSLLIKGSGSTLMLDLEQVSMFQMSDFYQDDDKKDDGESIVINNFHLNNPLFSFDGRRIMFNGDYEGNEIVLTSLSGLVVPVRISDGYVNLDGLQKGIYILQVAGTDFKFVLR